MNEFIDAISSPVNFGLTILLGCFVFYWAVVMIGIADIDAFDLDVDVDADAGGVQFMSFLKFLNVGEVPLMILLTVFSLVLWLVGVLSYMLIGSAFFSVPMQLLSLLPMGILAVLLTKLLTQPLRKLFSQLDQDASAGAVEVVGMRCRVISSTVTERMGQVEIETDAAPVRLNVRTSAGAAVLKRGDEAVVVADRDENGLYIVRGF